MNNERKAALEKHRQEIWDEKDKLLKQRISYYYSKLQRIRMESFYKVKIKGIYLHLLHNLKQ